MPATSTTTKRTGRPRNLQAQLTFPSVVPSSPSTPHRPQPEEVACIVYHYLVAHFPTAAAQLKKDARATMPAFLPLLEHQAVPLADVLTHFIGHQQSEAQERAIVATLASSTAEEGADDDEEEGGERKDGDDRGSGGVIGSTFTAMRQLLRDYSAQRREVQQVTAHRLIRVSIVTVNLLYILTHRCSVSASVPASLCSGCCLPGRRAPLGITERCSLPPSPPLHHSHPPLCEQGNEKRTRRGEGSPISPSTHSRSQPHPASSSPTFPPSLPFGSLTLTFALLRTTPSPGPMTPPSTSPRPPLLPPPPPPLTPCPLNPPSPSPPLLPLPPRRLPRRDRRFRAGQRPLLCRAASQPDQRQA